MANFARQKIARLSQLTLLVWFIHGVALGDNFDDFEANSAPQPPPVCDWLNSIPPPPPDTQTSTLNVASNVGGGSTQDCSCNGVDEEIPCVLPSFGCQLKKTGKTLEFDRKVCHYDPADNSCTLLEQKLEFKPGCYKEGQNCKFIHLPNYIYDSALNCEPCRTWQWDAAQEKWIVPSQGSNHCHVTNWKRDITGIRDRQPDNRSGDKNCNRVEIPGRDGTRIDVSQCEAHGSGCVGPCSLKALLVNNNCTATSNDEIKQEGTCESS